jgi:hypothetical protein
MPLVDGAVYDVPLLYGLRAPYNPVLPVEDDAARNLAAALAAGSQDLDGLVSEFEQDDDGEIWLYTAPYPGHGTVHVRLGKDRFDSKFTALLAFWRQAVLPRPDADFSLIDLRIDSQVITRETRAEAP